MKGYIITNAYSYTDAQRNQAERLREELHKAGAEAEIIKNFVLACLKNGEIVAKKADFIVFFDKDRVAARMLEKSGARLFNSANAIELCDDKMLTHIALAGGDIPMPDCLYAPLCYAPAQRGDAAFLQQVKNALGFPLVAKINFGSLGAGVELIRDMEQLERYESENISAPHFYQQFIDCGGGEDIRALVVGGKFVCAMRRRNDGDFRSNIGLGGRGENYSAGKELIALCERVAHILGLDFCGIDILTDRAGRQYVCEVNSNAFFAEAERVCGVNIAAAYAKHIISSIAK